MKLFLLKAIHGCKEFNPWYDKSFGHVVRAVSEFKARELASIESMDEGYNAWLDNKVTSCEVLTAKGEEEHIIGDYRGA